MPRWHQPGFHATYVGVVEGPRYGHYRCQRCGITAKYNATKRQNKPPDFCRDCKSILFYESKEKES